MSLSRGDVVAGAFEVERSLEADNAIEVYRARHLISGKRVTVKILKRSNDWCERLIERAKGLEDVMTDVVANCIYQGPAGRGRWCFAFEWIASDEIETKFPRGASLEVATKIGGRLAEGLSAVHEHGIAHGQVRPERVVMTGKDVDVPKLLDLVLPPDRSLLTAHARYVAPECVTLGELTREADVFALGVMLWELVARRPLSSSSTRLGVFLETLFDTPDNLDCDEVFASWITRMMAVEPLDRPEARQVEAALSGLAQGVAAPLLSAPTTREELDGRVGTALAVLVIRPPPGKEANEVGLGDEWKRDVEGLGLQLVTLCDGTLLGRIRGRTANGVAVSAGLVAKTTQEHAFRASVVAGLLDEGFGNSENRERTPEQKAIRIAALRSELSDIAGVASRTPASVTRFTRRLASYVGSALGLKPSADSYLLAPLLATKPKRGGTLEIDTTTTKMPAMGKRRKTGEIEIDEPRPPRGRGGTLVIEPEPGTKDPSAPTNATSPTDSSATETPLVVDGATPFEPEPRRGKQDTLVIEAEPPTQQQPEIATLSEAPSKPAPKVESTRAPTSIKTGWGRKADSLLQAAARVPPPIPTAAASLTPNQLPGSDSPTLEIEVSDELRELSKVDAEIKTRRGPAVK